MKIAIFYNLPFSGAKRVVFEHTKGLKKLGHTVDVYTLDQSDDIFTPGNIADAAYKYNYSQKKINFPFLRKISQDLSDFFLLKSLHRKIAKEIDKNKYDIALIHTDRLTQAPFILRFLKTKNVYFCLEPLKLAYEYGLFKSSFGDLSFPNRLYEKINIAIRKKIDRDNARGANRTLALSYFGRELMIEAFDLYPHVSYIGVDTDIFKKQSVKKKNQIFFVGQKVKINGYEEARKAIEKIPRKIRPKLVTLSISKGKKLSDKALVGLYSESLVTLSLSNFDTFGLVPLESLACETPVVAYNVAGYRETVKNNDNGYLVDFSVDEIANRIIYLINNPKIAESMGKKGRRWVEENWKWEEQIKKLNQYLGSDER